MNTIEKMSKGAVSKRFYERYDNGICLDINLPRITTEESENQFPPRDEGLHVLLINTPIREWSYPNIMPIGQGYMGSIVKMDGHKLDVLDLNAERREPVKVSPAEFEKWKKEKLEQKLSERRPDVIGLGGIITQYRHIKQVAKLCKSAYHDVPIVLGGGIATCMPDFMLQRMNIDVVIMEEGEIIFSELLHRLETKKPLKGLQGVAYRKYDRFGEFTVTNNGLRPNLKNQGMNGIPWPLRSAWPIDDIYKKNSIGHLNWENKWSDGSSTSSDLTSVSMIGSRGCPYGAVACDYCYATYLGKRYRLRSPEDVVAEMQYLKERYGVAYIHFLDDLLLTDFRWVLNFCKVLRERKQENGFEVMWGGTCRTNIIADDIIRAKKQGRKNFLEQCYEVGMRQVGYGIESASPIILKSIDKSGQTIEKMEMAVKETQRIMGYADCSFMIGSPGETRETIQETMEFCNKVNLKPEVLFFTTAYPATSFWDLAIEKGLITKSVTGEKGPVNDDIIEQYFMLLGEQGEAVRTNFSEMPDEEIVELSWKAIQELSAQNFVRHPHTGEMAPSKKPKLVGASHADV